MSAFGSEAVESHRFGVSKANPNIVTPAARSAAPTSHHIPEKKNGRASRGRSASINRSTTRDQLPPSPAGGASGSCELTRQRALKLRRASSRLLPLPATLSAP